MGTVEERLWANFHEWERIGRGDLKFEAPVHPEPPFFPYPGHFRQPKQLDGGIRHTRASGFLARLGRLFEAPPPPVEEPAPLSLEPRWRETEYDLIEFPLVLPADYDVPERVIESFLASVSLTAHPLTFELFGTSDSIMPQWVAHDQDAPLMRRQLAAHFPELTIRERRDGLLEAMPEWPFSVVECCLEREFMWPLAKPAVDPFLGLVGALSDLGDEECGLYQVTFAPARRPWAEEALRSLSDKEGKPFFSEPLSKAAQAKFSRRVFAVTLRLAAASPYLDRVWQLILDLASPLGLFADPAGNHLRPVHDQTPEEELWAELLYRQSRYAGMLLNPDELIGFVHPPSPNVVSAKLTRLEEDRRAFSSEPTHPHDLCLGLNEYGGVATPVRLSTDQRLRHIHIIGGTGTGKSTLLFELIRQDLINGAGVAVLEPHGDLIDKVLGVIPEHRVGDVVLLDPSDPEFITPFNILSAHSELERTLLASDLVSNFQRLSTSWGDQMNIVFQNAVLAFLESTEGGTLSDLRRFLLDAAYRERFLKTVTDPDVRYYWKQAFPKLGGGRSIGPILTRLEMFLAPKPIRYMVSRKENRLDFGEIMDGRKIFLARLSQGQIGKENAFLLGSLLVSKMQQTALSRQRLEATRREPFYCYIDEFQNFLTPSMAEVLSGARKYALGLILAHQDLKQLERDKDIASAVLANAHTRVVFRVSDSDARTLDDGFAHFEARHLQNLATGEAMCRIGGAANDFNLRVVMGDMPAKREMQERRSAVVASSRVRYGVPRQEIEAELLRKLEEAEAESATQEQRKRSTRIPKEAADAPAPIPEQTPEVAPSSKPVPFLPAPETPPRLSGMGRGGEDHRLIVGRIANEGGNLGYKVTKEATVPGGRVDVSLESRECRIAVEVAVNTNTAHEIENLTKCLEAGYDVVVSLSPLANVLENIERTACKQFTLEEFEKLKFFSPDGLIAWLNDLNAAKAPSPPAEDQPKIIGGRRVRVRKLEVSPEERRKLEAEQLDAITDLLKDSRNAPGNL